MNNQSQQIEEPHYSDFLNEAGWGEASVTPMGADMGLRRYCKLLLNNKQALLMDMSRAGRESSLKDYVDVDEYLASLGIRVPKIYNYDLDKGLAIVEIVGQKSFGDIIAEGADRKDLYRMATEILVKIRQTVTKNDLDLPSLENSIPRRKLNFFAESYMPAILQQEFEAQHLQEFDKVFQQIMDSAAPCSKIICHADFHLENLMWWPESDENYGLIDFQDAFWVQQPYDLVNLLEDARQTVPEDIKQEMKALYCADMDAAQRKGFDDWYVILSAFFHCKVLGQITYYSNEHGMTEYVQHIPRLQRYISDNLENPVLAPLKDFIERHNISLEKSPV